MSSVPLLAAALVASNCAAYYFGNFGYKKMQPVVSDPDSGDYALTLWRKPAGEWRITKREYRFPTRAAADKAYEEN